MASLTLEPGRAWQGAPPLPGDKSLSHRALILAALAEGESWLEGLSSARDPASTLGCLRRLGLEVRAEGRALRLRGWGRRGPREPDAPLPCGNSGTTMRLLAGVLASGTGLSVLTGDRSLRARPMARILGPLRRMGALVEGRAGGTLAPLVVRGASLAGREHRLPEASAQVKSCLLLAGLRAEGPTAIEEPAASRDHTERLLEALGAPLRREGRRVELPGSFQLPGFRFRVPGDPSAAAYLAAAAVLVPGSSVTLCGVNLNPGRTGFFRLLQRMGASVSWEVEAEELGEPVGTLSARHSPLEGIEVTPEEVPGAIDELPLLAAVATAAEGVTRVRGAAELRVKESDRIAGSVEELSRLGARIEATQDGFLVRGGGGLRGGTARCRGDHRLEMSLAVASLAARGPVRLLGAGWSAVSFPGFWGLFPGARA